MTGKPLNFDKGALSIQRGVELLPARRSALGLQLRPFQIAGGSGPISAFGGLAGEDKLRQYVVLQPVNFGTRDCVAAVCFHKRRVQGQTFGLSLDGQRFQFGFGGADIWLRPGTAAQGQPHPGRKRGIAGSLQPANADLPVKVGDCGRARESQAGLGDAAFVGELCKLGVRSSSAPNTSSDAIAGRASGSPDTAPNPGTRSPHSAARY